MDISYDNFISKQCYKCDPTVINNLNIVCSTSNNLIIFWNEFQIFVYENLELETAAITLCPEFQIHDLIISGNYLLCLDRSGNVHTTSLKLKNTTQRSLKFNFQPRELGIVASSHYDEDTLCLKYESESYFLCLHKINTEFSFMKNVILIYNDHLPKLEKQEKYLLKVQSITESQLEMLGKLLKAEDLNVRNKYNLIIVSFDKLDIYGCLFSPKMADEQVTLVKLYSCPSEICDIQVIESERNIIIGLNVGTIIILSLNDIESPKIIHLNVALHKFLAFDDTILYSDGKSLWKAENISQDIKFKQFFVKNVKDFVKLRDQLICTTFMNLIYTFSLDDEASYLKTESDEYCSAERVLNNSECLQKIIEEINKNDTLVKKITKEKNYITALSLSNRQDVMVSVINHKVIVYENYEDAIAENSKVILTNKFAEYFDTDSFFFLIRIATATEHKLDEVLSSSLGDLRVHITLATGTKVIRTISIKVSELSKQISFLIPLQTKEVDVTEMNVNIKIMSDIPGAFDRKQKIWTILYRKNIKLKSEHFIKFNLNLNKPQCLKNMDEPLEKMILQTAVNNYGNLFQFEDILRQELISKEWHMYVRLPDRYQDVFQNKDYTKDLTSKKVKYFLQQFTSEDFLKSKSNLIFSIANEKAKIEIYNDSFSSPLLKLSSTNLKVALNIRHFLSDLIYCVFANFSPGKEFINLSSYATVENLQKAVRKCITGPSQEDIEPLIEQFERNVIGVLPI